MSQKRGQITIRTFQPSDAEFCFRIRAEAFLTRFKEEIGEVAVVAGINAYQPADYIKISTYTEFFVVDWLQQPAGFFILRRTDPWTAELVLIYIDLKQTSSGLGNYCCSYLEKWIASHWLEVVKIYVDTVIPRYNAGFYQKMGYRKTQTVSCSFPGKTVPAIRLEKSLK